MGLFDKIFKRNENDSKRSDDRSRFDSSPSNIPEASPGTSFEVKNDSSQTDSLTEAEPYNPTDASISRLGDIYQGISAGDIHLLAVSADGRVIAKGNALFDTLDEINNWKDIVAVAASGFSEAGDTFSVGLKKNGRVVIACNKNRTDLNTVGWHNVVAISVGSDFALGLKSDGTVYSTGNDQDNRRDVALWKNVIRIAAGYDFSVGLTSNNTVLFTGSDTFELSMVTEWTDIIEISAGSDHILGLKKNGEVVAVGFNDNDQCEVSEWRNVISISAGAGYSVVIMGNGRVDAIGLNDEGQCDVSTWSNIVAISAGSSIASGFTIGLRSNGTLIATGNNTFNQCEVEDVKNVKLPMNIQKTKESSDSDDVIKKEPARKAKNQDKNKTNTLNADKTPDEITSMNDEDEASGVSNQLFKEMIMSAVKGMAPDLLDNMDLPDDQRSVLKRIFSNEYAHRENANNSANEEISPRQLFYDSLVCDTNPERYNQAVKVDQLTVPVPDKYIYSTNLEETGGRSIIAMLPEPGINHVSADSFRMYAYHALMIRKFDDDDEDLTWDSRYQMALQASTMNSDSMILFDDDHAFATIQGSESNEPDSDCIIYSGAIVLNTGRKYFVQSQYNFNDDLDVLKKHASCIFRMMVSSKSDWPKIISSYGISNDQALSTAKNGANKEKSNIYTRHSIAAGGSHTVGLMQDGRVIAVGRNIEGQCNVESWSSIISIAAGENHTVGLKNDGTVIATGDNAENQCSVSSWKNIVEVAAGYDHTVGLMSNGRVVATGWNYQGKCDTSGFREIKSIAAGGMNTFGLLHNGKVKAVGMNKNNSLYFGQADVENWEDIKEISASADNTIGLKADGTVLAIGQSVSQTDVEQWTEIISVSAGQFHSLGLKQNGTVLASNEGWLMSGISVFEDTNEIKKWRDIIEISAGNDFSIGLRKDGSVVAYGKNDDGQCDVSSWRNLTTSTSQTNMKDTTPKSKKGVKTIKSDTKSRENQLSPDQISLTIADGVDDANSNPYKSSQSEFENRVIADSWGTYAMSIKGEYYSTITGDQYNDFIQEINQWENVIKFTAFNYSKDYMVCFGIRQDGSVIAAQWKSEYYEISFDHEDKEFHQKVINEVISWRNIIAISKGPIRILGLRLDGTVVAAGKNEDGEGNVSGWRNISKISAGCSFSLGLCKNGTVQYAGYWDEIKDKCSKLKGIIDIAAGWVHSIMLSDNGKVISIGTDAHHTKQIKTWSDIIDVSAGFGFSVGLRNNGTVEIAYNENCEYNLTDVISWKDIIAITTGHTHVVGLKRDGSLCAAGDNNNGKCNVDNWKDIGLIKETHTNDV